MGPRPRVSKGGRGGGQGAQAHVRSPSAQRELLASQAATQATQQMLQASQQQLQQALAARAPSVPLGRTASGHSSRLATQAQAGAAALPLTLGASGYYIHPTKGTMPHIVTPTLPAITATAAHARVLRSTPSAGYAHPSLGIMPNVTVPVPVSNAQLVTSQQQPQGLLTTAPALPAPNPFLNAPAPAMHALSVASTTSSQQTIVQGGAAQMPLPMQPQSQPASAIVPGHAGWYAHTSPTAAHRQQQFVAALAAQQLALNV